MKFEDHGEEKYRWPETYLFPEITIGLNYQNNIKETI